MKDRLVTIALSIAGTLGFLELKPKAQNELVVDRLVVRNELIVSDTGRPWESGFEEQQIPRGIYAQSKGAGSAGLWVRSRIHKGEIDDPFDDRFHAIHRDGSPFPAPGHISWNVWIDGAWRQMAIIQGEGLEHSEVPKERWSGGNHPGRLRFQSFRPGHGEPLTDAVIGQGMMSLGGGGYGGSGLNYPSEVLQLWGGKVQESPLAAPEPPRVVKDDGSGKHTYALVAVGPQGKRGPTSKSVTAGGLATIRWDSVPGGDSYLVLRDGREVSGLLRIEGSEKQWTDPPGK